MPETQKQPRKLARAARLRDWPIRVYRYAIVDIDVGDAVWERYEKMQALWDALCEAHRQVREAINDETTPAERKEMWAQFKETSKQLRHSFGLTWHERENVLLRFETAVHKAAKASRGDKGKAVNVNWPQAGRLSLSLRVRIPGGRPATYLGNPSSPLYIGGALIGEVGKRFRNAGQRGGDSRYRWCSFKLTQTERIDFRIQMHRPLPENGIFKVATLKRQVRGSLPSRWWLSLTFEVPPTVRKKTGKACAIDPGWRRMDEQIRFAYLVDNTGHAEELTLPLDFSNYRTRRAWERYGPDNAPPQTYDELWDLQRRRDKHLDEAKAAIAAILSPLPAGFTKMRRGGLVRLMRRLEEQPHLTDSESEALDIIRRWQEQDFPLLRRQSRASERFANRRTDIYRKLAVIIAKRYDDIFIEDNSFQTMTSDIYCDKERDHCLKAADRYRQMAAPADFVTILKFAASRYGANVTMLRPQPGDPLCCKCGGKIEPGPDQFLTCTNGHRVDQDYNAARNLLSRGLA